MAPATLSASSVVVAFGGLRALDGVDVDFAGDAITGLIGPNGSGKSTLVNAMSGQIHPRGGAIRFGEADITTTRADRIVRLGLARTYQIPRMPPQLSVEDVLAVPLRYGRRGHLPQGLASPAAIAGFCGLGAMLHRPCAGLSVTELRRLEIARALACGPAMLLLDEVMAGLSHADSLEVMEVVRNVHAAGIGIVIIEHLMRVITALCHRVVVLNNGALLTAGTPAQVLADPAVREAYLGKGFTQ